MIFGDFIKEAIFLQSLDSTLSRAPSLLTIFCVCGFVYYSFTVLRIENNLVSVVCEALESAKRDFLGDNVTEDRIDGVTIVYLYTKAKELYRSEIPGCIVCTVQHMV